MDNRILVFLFTIAAVILSAAVGVMVGFGDLMIPSILLIAFGSTLLIANPSIATFLVVTIYASGFTVPGLTGNIGLKQIVEAAVIGLSILLIVFKRTSAQKASVPHILLAIFCGIVLFTGTVRGFGFRFLGSNLWGGTFYLDILLCALLVVSLPRVNMPAKWWPVAVVTMGLLATVPFLAELLTIKFGLSFVTLFVQLDQSSVATQMADADAGGGVGRLVSIGPAVGFMIIGYLAIIHTRKLFTSRAIIPLAVLLGIFFLSLLSGFRLITALIFLTIFLAVFYQKTLTPLRTLFAGTSTLTLVAILYYISDNLPLNIQRAISWLPNISVSAAASDDATQTVDWRLDVWRVAIQYIPEYFWIGKGLAFDGNLLVASKTNGAGWDPISWALIQGAYHNGYLSLLLLLGIFGFFVGLSLLVTVLWRLIKFNSAAWKNPSLHLCYQAFLASITGLIIVYLTVYGDVTSVFPNFLFQWAVLEAIRACDVNQLTVTSSSTRIVDEESIYAAISP